MAVWGQSGTRSPGGRLTRSEAEELGPEPGRSACDPPLIPHDLVPDLRTPDDPSRQVAGAYYLTSGRNLSLLM